MLHLEQMGLLRIPEDLRGIMASESHRGAPDASKRIEVTAPAARPHIVYVQPLAAEAADSVVISFADYAEVVARHEDPLSQRFARSLREWAASKAGERQSSRSYSAIVTATPPRLRPD
jgi:hypothetical protein